MRRTAPGHSAPSPRFHTTLVEVVSSPAADLACNSPTYKADLQRNLISSFEPISPDVGTTYKVHLQWNTMSSYELSGQEVGKFSIGHRGPLLVTELQ
ncbi:hypothetical protein AVEN_143474-1 [Araneus ventricosus]|uniref:Uncharacterized protein n=1 Tax=Araneus ventricosus TaxID=182803 RepID=A0A4Y2VRZ5_ARAVE|nr:hypothetical protein AVEN_143474-1 [Araneus ventricosus]